MGVYVNSIYAGGISRGLTITVLDGRNNLVSISSYDTHSGDREIWRKLSDINNSMDNITVIISSYDSFNNYLYSKDVEAMHTMGSAAIDRRGYRSSFLFVSKMTNKKWSVLTDQYSDRYGSKICFSL